MEAGSGTDKCDRWVAFTARQRVWADSSTLNAIDAAGRPVSNSPLPELVGRGNTGKVAPFAFEAPLGVAVSIEWRCRPRA